jgi:hypothetical protein
MKDFVPYKESLELKALGFDEPCFMYYNHYSDDISIRRGLLSNPINYNNVETNFESLLIYEFRCKKEVRNSLNERGLLYHLISAPTFSQAFRWFREKYDLNFYVWKKEDLFRIVLQRPFENSYFFNNEFNTYEEAELECLRKLIEIVKNDSNTTSKREN